MWLSFVLVCVGLPLGCVLLSFVLVCIGCARCVCMGSGVCGVCVCGAFCVCCGVCGVCACDVCVDSAMSVSSGVRVVFV